MSLRMRLHLVDGTYELFRAFFTPRPPHYDVNGRDVTATVGLLRTLLVLLEDPSEEVTHIAVAFDNPVRSFRNDRFAGYKTEEGVDAALLAQFDLAEEATLALGITVWSMKEFEADDALATGAAMFASQVEQVRIATPDKDLHQCLAGSHVVQLDRMRKKVIDEAAARAKLGVAPQLVPDYLALVGDPADGIPGIPGYGAKTSALLLDHYGGLEPLLIAATAGKFDVPVRGAARLAQTLALRSDDALLYRELATLRRDVPLHPELERLRFRGTPQEPWQALCDSLAVKDLRDRPRAWRVG